MTRVGRISIACTIVVFASVTAAADTPPRDEAFPVLTHGHVVFVNTQRLVVTQEPPPVAEVAEAPPAPLEPLPERPRAPSRSAIWVDGHWTPGGSGFLWVSGHFVPFRPGYVFVPPRWAALDGRFVFFNGFFVPFGVFVRSHFNKLFFSGVPPQSWPRIDRGPYWPVGLPVPGRPLTSANARDPYWPVGAPTRANSPFNRNRVTSPRPPLGVRR